MNPIIDNAIALRIVYLLQMPFVDFDAYKLGIIDENGEVIKKKSQMSEKERDSITLLHRLIFRVKRLLSALPGGESRIKALAASFLLMRECIENNKEDIYIEDIQELALLLTDAEICLFEEIASTAVGNVQGLDTEPVVRKKIKMVRRNEKYKYPKFKEYKDGTYSNN